VKILPHKFSKINFKALKAELWFWVGFGVFLFAIGKVLDAQVFQFIEEYVRSPLIDHYILFLTEELLWWILILFALVTGYRVWTNPDNQTKLLPALFALVATGILAFVFKSLFAIPRPFIEMNLIPLTYAPSLSFPSFHTAVAFALLIPFFRISRVIGSAWLLFALFIGFARVYENLHYPSDIAGGIFLGGIVGAFFSHPDIKKILEVLWEELEFRRQSLHFVAGFMAVFAHWAGFLRLRHIAILLVVGLMISLLTQKGKLSFVQKLLKFFDRPRDKNFPGRGAFYLLFGIFITFLIFPIKIAYAAILILSVGDSLNRLFASRVPGHLKFPWNRRKNCIGVAIGITAGTLVAQFFVPIVPAFLASVFAIVGETIPVRFGKFYIDDNIFVPLIAGGVLWVLV
jgi:undecaprenyl-diphosphatase